LSPCCLNIIQFTFKNLVLIQFDFVGHPVLVLYFLQNVLKLGKHGVGFYERGMFELAL